MKVKVSILAVSAVIFLISTSAAFLVHWDSNVSDAGSFDSSYIPVYTAEELSWVSSGGFHPVAGDESDKRYWDRDKNYYLANDIVLSETDDFNGGYDYHVTMEMANVNSMRVTVTGSDGTVNGMSVTVYLGSNNATRTDSIVTVGTAGITSPYTILVYGTDMNHTPNRYFAVSYTFDVLPSRGYLLQNEKFNSNGNFDTISSGYTGRVATSSDGFKGIFDGNSHTISGLEIAQYRANTDPHYAGLFNIISEDGVVKNLGLVDNTISIVATARPLRLGSIAGISFGTVENCFNTSAINFVDVNYAYIGGIVGETSKSIEDCYNSGYITGFCNNGSNIGGLVGYATAPIIDSYNIGIMRISEGAATNTSSAGGLVGTTISDIRRSFNKGNISYSSSLTGEQASLTPRIGGIVGITEGSAFNNVTECFNEGSIVWSRSGASDDTYVGGIVGYSNSTHYADCYNVGSITTSGGNVSGNYAYSGGIAGGVVQGGSFTNCYNTVTPTLTGGNMVAGAISGIVSGTISITNCYFLSGSLVGTGDSYVDGSNIEDNTSRRGGDEITGEKTSNQLKDALNKTIFYTGDTMTQYGSVLGWNFMSIWGFDPNINSGYPVLLNGEIIVSWNTGDGYTIEPDGYNFNEIVPGEGYIIATDGANLSFTIRLSAGYSRSLDLLEEGIRYTVPGTSITGTLTPSGSNASLFEAYFDWSDTGMTVTSDIEFIVPALSINTYDIVVEDALNGKVGYTTNEDPFTVTEDYGTDIPLAITPDSGYVIVSVTDDITYDDGTTDQIPVVISNEGGFTYTIYSVAEDHNVTVVFGRRLNLEVTVGFGDGKIEVTVGGIVTTVTSGVYSVSLMEGTAVELKAIETGTNNDFSYWTGLPSIYNSSDPEQMILMEGDYDISAVFTDGSQDKKLNLTVEGNGKLKVTVNGNTLYVMNTDEFLFSEGVSVELEAIADTNNSFSMWLGDLTGDNITETVDMDDDRVIKAVFADSATMKTLYLSTSVNGYIEWSADSVSWIQLISSRSFPDSMPIWVKATEDQGYSFSEWTDDISGSMNPIAISMTTDMIVGVVFTENLIPPVPSVKFTIVSFTDNGATISPSGNTIVNAGRNASYFFEAKEGYTISDVIINGISHPELVTVGSYRFTNVRSNGIIEIHTTSATVTLDVSIGEGNGYVEYRIGSGDFIRYTGPVEIGEGVNVALRAVAADGYKFDHWLGVSGNARTTEIQINDVFTDIHLDAFFHDKDQDSTFYLILGMIIFILLVCVIVFAALYRTGYVQ